MMDGMNSVNKLTPLLCVLLFLSGCNTTNKNARLVSECQKIGFVKRTSCPITEVPKLKFVGVDTNSSVLAGEKLDVFIQAEIEGDLSLVENLLLKIKFFNVDKKQLGTRQKILPVQGRFIRLTESITIPSSASSGEYLVEVETTLISDLKVTERKFNITQP